MTEDLINKKDIYFPSYSGTNDNLITLLNRATQILCEWFSKTEKSVHKSRIWALSNLSVSFIEVSER